MGTFVAPMGSAAVAMPAASRWRDRVAVLEEDARLSMAEDVEGVEETKAGLASDGGDQVEGGKSRRA